jgi:hypothetical protein
MRPRVHWSPPLNSSMVEKSHTLWRVRAEGKTKQWKLKIIKQTCANESQVQNTIRKKSIKFLYRGIFRNVCCTVFTSCGSNNKYSEEMSTSTSKSSNSMAEHFAKKRKQGTVREGRKREGGREGEGGEGEVWTGADHPRIAWQESESGEKEQVNAALTSWRLLRE